MPVFQNKYRTKAIKCKKLTDAEVVRTIKSCWKRGKKGLLCYHCEQHQKLLQQQMTREGERRGYFLKSITYICMYDIFRNITHSIFYIIYITLEKRRRWRWQLIPWRPKRMVYRHKKIKGCHGSTQPNGDVFPCNTLAKRSSARSLINNENFRSIVLEHKSDREKRSSSSLTVAVPDILHSAKCFR